MLPLGGLWGPGLGERGHSLLHRGPPGHALQVAGYIISGKYETQNANGLLNIENASSAKFLYFSEEF